MCAAPGSKTAQLIEMVSAPTPTTGTANPTGDGQATGKGDGEVGLVVANDSDRDRAYMLAHQCKRVKSPAICITWCAAQSLPNLGAAGAEKGSDKGESAAGFERRAIATKDVYGPGMTEGGGRGGMMHENFVEGFGGEGGIPDGGIRQ